MYRSLNTFRCPVCALIVAVSAEHYRSLGGVQWSIPGNLSWRTWNFIFQLMKQYKVIKQNNIACEKWLWKGLYCQEFSHVIVTKCQTRAAPISSQLISVSSGNIKDTCEGLAIPVWPALLNHPKCTYKAIPTSQSAWDTHPSSACVGWGSLLFLGLRTQACFSPCVCFALLILKGIK